MGYSEAKQLVLQALKTGNFLHEARDKVDVKNELATGTVTPDFVASIIRQSNGKQHRCEPHHSMLKGVDVHIIKCSGWYIKFYFLDPMTIFISVHQ